MIRKTVMFAASTTAAAEGGTPLNAFDNALLERMLDEAFQTRGAPIRERKISTLTSGLSLPGSSYRATRETQRALLGFQPANGSCALASRLLNGELPVQDSINA